MSDDVWLNVVKIVHILDWRNAIHMMILRGGIQMNLWLKTTIFIIRYAASDMIVRNTRTQDVMITKIENKEE